MARIYNIHDYYALKKQAQKVNMPLYDYLAEIEFKGHSIDHAVLLAKDGVSLCSEMKYTKRPGFLACSAVFVTLAAAPLGYLPQPATWALSPVKVNVKQVAVTPSPLEKWLARKSNAVEINDN